MSFPQVSNPTPEEETIEVKKTELKNVEKYEAIVTKRGLWARILPKLSDRDKSRIAMHADDRKEFATFLDKENTGFVRLHDTANCEDKNYVLDINNPCPWDILGKATAYSFRKRKYQRIYFSDIRVAKEKIEIVGLNLLGFLTDLGAVDLEKISLQTNGIKEMWEYEPSNNINEVEKLFNLAKRGFKLNNSFYKTDLPIKLNTTYGLRSIAFEGKIYRKLDGIRVNLLGDDKRNDVTVVFRIIRKYEDGSYGILWRELQRKSAPKLKDDKQILK
ncbi:MAG: hypothetical protein HC846_10855 [Blastocatellia bacterium]|nr:hypothetical protein [Blastocatellia bacterium]